MSVRADGGFTYKPAGGFSGSDSFTYHANDGDGEQQGRDGLHHGDPAAPARRRRRRRRRRRCVVPSTTSINSLAFPKFTKLAGARG